MTDREVVEALGEALEELRVKLGRERCAGAFCIVVDPEGGVLSASKGLSMQFQARLLRLYADKFSDGTVPIMPGSDKL